MGPAYKLFYLCRETGARHGEFIGENENEASRVIVIAFVLSVLFAVGVCWMRFASSNGTQPTI